VLLAGAAGTHFVSPDLLIVDAFPTTDPPTSDSFRNTSAE
jgi:hypothetical protein